MTSVVVTGANRGIGLGLVKELLKRKDVGTVFATSREGSNSKDLQSIKDPRLHLLIMDAGDDRSIAEAAGKVRDKVGDAGINVLINNAGILTEYDLEGTIDRTAINDNLNINGASPVIVSQSFNWLLRKSAAAGKKTVIATISSSWGSIALTQGANGRNTIGYNMSKAAANMATKTMAGEWKGNGITVVSFCPGWVATDMGTSAATVTVEESTAALVSSILDKVDIKHTGGFYDRNFQTIAW